METFLRNSPTLPYLFDPITQSVVYYQKNVPLFEEALTFMNVIKEKFDNKERMLINDTRLDDDGDIGGGLEMRIRRSQGRHMRKHD